MSRQLKRVLVVEPNSEIREIIEENLDEVCANKTYKVLPPREVKSKHDANMVITDAKQPSFDLAIINTNIPDEKKSPSKEEGGLELVKSWRNRQIKVPVIFIDSDHNLYPEINALDNTELVLLGEKFEQKLQEQSKLWLEHKIQAEERRFELCINLDSGNNCMWKIHGLNFPAFTEDKLSITSEQMDDLKKISTELSKWVDRARSNSQDPLLRNHWQKELKDLGEKLWEQIFYDNKKSALCKIFYTLCGECQGIEKAQICFKVRENACPILLEALAERNQGFIMLKVPIYRQLIMPGVIMNLEQYPFFHPKGRTQQYPINCLIIEANTQGDYSYLLNKSFKKLDNVPVEANSLERYFLDNKEQLNIGNVKRISANSANSAVSSFKEQVKRALTKSECKWHIVHFAGHSYYDQENKKGYIILPGYKGIEEVEMQQFAGWLIHTSFVYLSSCHSSEEDFVFNLVNNKVPAVLGFRWDLEDDKAAEYTQNFYESLFNLKSLEYAFLEAKKFMHDKYQDNPIWASPILMMQIPV